MKNHIITDVAILGGGISGLATAQFLSQKGLRVCVLEKSQRIGGAIRTERRDNFLVEYGPNSTLDTTPLLHDLFTGVQVDGEVEYANSRSSNRYIVRDGRLNALPMSPLSFLRTPLFSTRAKLRLLKEPFIAPAGRDADESLAEFVERRLGREFLDYAINPFVAGVYAGSPEALSVRSAFPKLHQLEQDYGSLIKGTIKGANKRRQSSETAKAKARLLSFRNGLQTVIDALGKSLGEQIHTGVTVSEITEHPEGIRVSAESGRGERLEITANALILAVPAHAYRDLPFSQLAPLRQALGHILYPPVAMVYFGYKERPSGNKLDGFGFLVPEKEKRQILGTIWSSTIFSNRAPVGGAALTTFVGGSRQPENALLTEGQIVDLVGKDLRQLMGIDERPDVVVVKQWNRAIPQYRIGHRYIVEKIEQFENNHPGTFITGNFRGGISVSDCIKQSHQVSGQVAAYVRQREKRSQETVLG